MTTGAQAATPEEKAAIAVEFAELDRLARAELLASTAKLRALDAAIMAERDPSRPLC